MNGEITHGTLDTAVAALGSKATTAGVTTSTISWILSSEFGVLAGLLIGLGGFVVNWYFKVRQDKRDQLKHEAEMAMIRGRHGQ